MAPRNSKKRVRIQTGHEARFIEKIRNKKKNKVSQKYTHRSRFEKFGPRKWHRPTVSQLVYQFLERASNQGVIKTQKSNASNLFRKSQRRRMPKQLKPDSRRKLVFKKIHYDKDDLKKPYKFPYTKLPSEEGVNSIQKCIFEVLSFGTVLGLLEPIDNEGIVFRISSDLQLFNEDKDRHRLKRKIQDPYENKIPEKRCCWC